MDLSSVLDKKVGDFNKKGIWKPYIYWLKDSERLYYSFGGSKMGNEFEGFVMPQARMLPVILLLDVSSSMAHSNKMTELNNSVREMIDSFKKSRLFSQIFAFRLLLLVVK